MRNSRRGIDNSRRFSSIRPLTNAVVSTSRFETVARLDFKPLSRETILSWRPKIFAIFVVWLMIAGLYEFSQDDWFFIYQVEIRGLNYLTPHEIERTSGIMGYNIFFVEPSAVERALKNMPEVKSARVMTGIPNLALIQIEERAPEVIWLKGAEVYWVDAEGIAFKAHAPRADLPTVRDLEPSEVNMGKRVQPVAFNAWNALNAVWSDAPRNFEWSSSNGLSAMDEHGWIILFGDASDMDFKVATLKTLIPRLVSQGTKIKLIDLGKGDPYYH